MTKFGAIKIIDNIIQTSTQAFVLIRTLKFRNELREDRKLYMNRVDINKIMCRLHQALAYLLMGRYCSRYVYLMPLTPGQ